LAKGSSIFNIFTFSVKNDYSSCFDNHNSLKSQSSGCIHVAKTTCPDTAHFPCKVLHHNASSFTLSSLFWYSLFSTTTYVLPSWFSTLALNIYVASFWAWFALLHNLPSHLSSSQSLKKYLLNLRNTLIAFLHPPNVTTLVLCVPTTSLPDAWGRFPVA